MKIKEWRIYILLRRIHTRIYRWYVKYYYRNSHEMNGNLCEINKIQLEYWNDKLNIGDQLAPIIFHFMMKRTGLNPNVKVNGTKHLLTIGSLLDGNHADAVVWGSGILELSGLQRLAERKNYMKYDIRAVRGPISKEIMESNGYKCPDVYGDPGVLMPLIYQPAVASNKKYKVSIIYSYSSSEERKTKMYHEIDIRTSDYKKVIDEIVESERIISESLHGIILAETYDVPAIYLRENITGKFPLKYYDWYYSTNRYNIKIATSLQEAVNMEPMVLPQLSEMRQRLLEAFPVDIFQEN